MRAKLFKTKTMTKARQNGLPFSLWSVFALTLTTKTLTIINCFYAQKPVLPTVLATKTLTNVTKFCQLFLS
jgi:hypothetical protein